MAVVFSWIACFVIFLQTLPKVESGPRWDWGLIGEKPGLGLRPRNSNEHIDSRMFILKGRDTNIHPSDLDGEGDLNADYAMRVNKFFTNYEKRPAPAVPGPDPAKPLFKGYQRFDYRGMLGECGDFPYGYIGEQVKPCIYLKMNNILGWKPEPVKCGDPDAIAEDGLPYDDCPDTLRRHMASPIGKEAGGQNIWIDCNGREAADKEALEGDGIFYWPAYRTIPLSFFPYLGERNEVDKHVGYHPPLVAIQVDPREPGQLVHVECRAFYRGVNHHKKDNLDLVQFEVQILHDNLPERTGFVVSGLSQLGLQPSNTDEHIDSQMFLLKGGDTNIHPSDMDGEGDLNADYAVRVNKFFTTYEKRPAPAVPGPDPAKPLFKGYQRFDYRGMLGECGHFPFGYIGEQVKPCIYLKMNNILGWKPEPVKCGDPDTIAEDGLPYDDCPFTLRDHLASVAAKEAGDQNIWIDCSGREADDKEALVGRVSYSPASRAIPLTYFPYLGERNEERVDVGYHSPLVAIQVDPREPGHLPHLECRAFYRGVNHHKKDTVDLGFQQTGSVEWFFGLFSKLTLPEVESKWDWGWEWDQDWDWGLIGKKARLGLQPRNTDEHIDSRMFLLKGGDTNIHPSDLDGEGDLNADYAVRVNKFFTTYEKRPAPAVPGPDPTKPLFKGYQRFDYRGILGECGHFPFGYISPIPRYGEQMKPVKPCIYLKMNNIMGWKPEPVKCGDPDAIAEDGLPYDDCPFTLRKHLASVAAKEAGDQNIWIDCNGREAADKEALEGYYMEGKISYWPASRAISLTYFPYLGERNEVDRHVGYHPPLVAIQVDPRVPGQLVHLECRAFYRGVNHHKKDNLDLVQFEVQIVPRHW